MSKNIDILGPGQRLYQLTRPVIALTGGIGTGKTTVTRWLRESGLAVICADELIKSIYRLPEIQQRVLELVPEAIVDQQIDFRHLRRVFFSQPEIKEQLSETLYNQLPKAFEEAANSYTEAKFLIYDIPLLFERDLAEKFDLVCVVYAPVATQIQRVIERDHLTLEQARNIIQSQLPIDHKRAMADYIIENTSDLDTLHQLTMEFSQFLLQKLS